MEASQILLILRLLILLFAVSATVWLLMSLLKIWVESREHRKIWFILLFTIFVFAPLLFISAKHYLLWDKWNFAVYAFLLVVFVAASVYGLRLTPTLFRFIKDKFDAKTEDQLLEEAKEKPLPKIKAIGQKDVAERLLEHLGDQHKDAIREFVFKNIEAKHKLRIDKETHKMFPIDDKEKFVELFWLMAQNGTIEDSFNQVAEFLSAHFPVLGSAANIAQKPSKKGFKLKQKRKPRKMFPTIIRAKS